MALYFVGRALIQLFTPLLVTASILETPTHTTTLSYHTDVADPSAAPSSSSQNITMEGSSAPAHTQQVTTQSPPVGTGYNQVNGFNFPIGEVDMYTQASREVATSTSSATSRPKTSILRPMANTHSFVSSSEQYDSSDEEGPERFDPQDLYDSDPEASDKIVDTTPRVIISNSRVRRAHKQCEAPAAAAPPDTTSFAHPTNSILGSASSSLAGALDNVRPPHPIKGSARVKRALAGLGAQAAQSAQLNSMSMGRGSTSFSQQYTQPPVHAPAGNGSVQQLLDAATIQGDIAPRQVQGGSSQSSGVSASERDQDVIEALLQLGTSRMSTSAMASSSSATSAPLAPSTYQVAGSDVSSAGFSGESITFSGAPASAGGFVQGSSMAAQWLPSHHTQFTEDKSQVMGANMGAQPGAAGPSLYPQTSDFNVAGVEDYQSYGNTQDNPNQQFNMYQQSHGTYYNANNLLWQSSSSSSYTMGFTGADMQRTMDVDEHARAYWQQLGEMSSNLTSSDQQPTYHPATTMAGYDQTSNFGQGAGQQIDVEQFIDPQLIQLSSPPPPPTTTTTNTEGMFLTPQAAAKYVAGVILPNPTPSHDDSQPAIQPEENSGNSMSPNTGLPVSQSEDYSTIHMEGYNDASSAQDGESQQPDMFDSVDESLPPSPPSPPLMEMELELELPSTNTEAQPDCDAEGVAAASQTDHTSATSQPDHTSGTPMSLDSAVHMPPANLQTAAMEGLNQEGDAYMQHPTVDYHSDTSSVQPSSSSSSSSTHSVELLSATLTGLQLNTQNAMTPLESEMVPEVGSPSEESEGESGSYSPTLVGSDFEAAELDSEEDHPKEPAVEVVIQQEVEEVCDEEEAQKGVEEVEVEASLPTLAVFEESEREVAMPIPEQSREEEVQEEANEEAKLIMPAFALVEESELNVVEPVSEECQEPEVQEEVVEELQSRHIADPEVPVADPEAEVAGPVGEEYQQEVPSQKEAEDEVASSVPSSSLVEEYEEVEAVAQEEAGEEVDPPVSAVEPGAVVQSRVEGKAESSLPAPSFAEGSDSVVDTGRSVLKECQQKGVRKSRKRVKKASGDVFEGLGRLRNASPKQPLKLKHERQPTDYYRSQYETRPLKRKLALAAGMYEYDHPPEHPLNSSTSTTGESASDKFIPEPASVEVEVQAHSTPVVVAPEEERASSEDSLQLQAPPAVSADELEVELLPAPRADESLSERASSAAPEDATLAPHPSSTELEPEAPSPASPAPAPQVAAALDMPPALSSQPEETALVLFDSSIPKPQPTSAALPSMDVARLSSTEDHAADEGLQASSTVSQPKPQPAPASDPPTQVLPTLPTAVIAAPVPQAPAASKPLSSIGVSTQPDDRSLALVNVTRQLGPKPGPCPLARVNASPAGQLVSSLSNGLITYRQWDEYLGTLPRYDEIPSECFSAYRKWLWEMHSFWAKGLPIHDYVGVIACNNGGDIEMKEPDGFYADVGMLEPRHPLSRYVTPARTMYLAY
ncbi:hypothetical protein D9613_008654 [Agrocybe pediades]|uniref:Uncharacterized protein n=1 Tax=Agrocybe pediades TaxID=84607 RepID=A0A8H4QU61_9AGAR|nr:hypothetical protein D9613_008654 [Agrocybe pediades]